MDVRIFPHRNAWRLETETRLPRPRAEVFPFFADCRNLERLTPPQLDFSILRAPDEMEEGAIIDYRLRLHGIPFLWKTEITGWQPPFSFVDVQRRGPYRRWEHEHLFLEEGDTTLMVDRVDFLAPGGKLVHERFVNEKVRGIFRYRAECFAELFAPVPAAVAPLERVA